MSDEHDKAAAIRMILHGMILHPFPKGEMEALREQGRKNREEGRTIPVWWTSPGTIKMSLHTQEEIDDMVARGIIEKIPESEAGGQGGAAHPDPDPSSSPKEKPDA